MINFFKILFAVFLPLFLFLVSFTGSSRSPQKSQGGDKIDTVVIDAGHGGKDPGATGLTGIHEKDITLSIAIKLKSLIEDKYPDTKVIMIREDDTFVELKERGRIANEHNAKLFLSIHCNAKETEENDRSGFEVYVLDNSRTGEAVSVTMNENRKIKQGIEPAGYILSSLAQSVYLRNSERLGAILQTELTKGTMLENRGLYAEGFLVLTGASMPAVLIECGYLSNQRDELYLRSEKGQAEIANSIYKAVRLYKFDYDFENTQ